jgi:hypothetical protein
MRQRASLVVVTLLAAMLVGGVAFAQSAGSFAGDFLGPNGGASVVTTQVCSATDTSCISTQSATLMTASIKVSGSSSKSLMLMGSLEDALYTDTSNSGGGSKSSSTATGSIVVTPVVTGGRCPAAGCPVYPSSVTFAARSQTLTANLGSCTVTSVTNPTEVLTCTDTDTIELLLSTMSANSFNFLVPNMGEGVYTVNFNVAITASATSDSLSAGATASAGIDVSSLGVLTVQTQTPFNSLNFQD